MIRVPKYTVTVWYWTCVQTMKYRELLIKVTEAFPMNADESKGVCYMHWGTKHESEAKAILKKLKPFISDPNVIVIRLSSLREDFKPIVYKDGRYTITPSGKRSKKVDT